MTPIRKRKNSGARKSLKLKEIADLVGGELIGDPTTPIMGVAGIKEARAGDITFLSNSKYLPFLEETKASAVVVSKDIVSKKKTLLRTSDPSKTFSKVVSLFAPVNSKKLPGVHPTAVLGENVRLGAAVSVGPHVVIEEDSVIGDHSVIGAGTFIGEGCRLGQEVHLYPNVTVRETTEIGDRVIIHSGAVIGSDGFGFETIEDIHVKIPQIGFVLIEDDVEIGANVCIDRARFEKTWIKKGTKIDNLVQIAHNVVIGSRCLVVSQAGISGSTELGENVVVAGQAGLVGHITIGDRAVIGARSGVTKSVPADSVMLGGPAKPIQEQKKLFALISRLPELFKDLSEIKKRLTKSGV